MIVKFKYLLLAILLSLLCSSALYAQEKVYVFAAASTTNAVKELINTYTENSGTAAEYLTSFASSSTLARQIEAGADANIYISANVKWYQWLADKNLVEPGSDFIMAANALVLIAGPGNDATMHDIAKLPQLLEKGYLAMGDATHVPAGMYGKEALDYYNLWDTIRKKLAQYSNVRVALNAVDTSQADFGIVYKTDAMQSQKARIIYTFAPKSHTPIQYPICAIKGKKTAEAEKFLQFMKTPKAKSILAKYGFVAQ